MSPVQRSTSLPNFTEMNDLASEKCGGKVIFATDDWFAAAENLIKVDAPIWKDGFTEFGKWMDGWETRRKRTAGHDWCIIKLGLAGTIRGVELDTRFFTGNFTPRISVQAARITSKELEKLETPARKQDMGKCATKEEFEKINSYGSDNWEMIVDMSELNPGYPNCSKSYFSVPTINKKFTHVRLNYYPDGGVARFRVYGVAVPELSRIATYSSGIFKSFSNFVRKNNDKNMVEMLESGDLMDLMAMENGCICIGYSDAHYGHPRNLIGPGRALTMADGWETARRLDRPAILKTSNKEGVLDIPGFEWCAFKLGIRGIPEMIEVDTNHFKGNFADSIMIEGARAPNNWNEVLDELKWERVIKIQKLNPHQTHYFKAIQKHHDIDVCRVIIRPDGGISRIRMFGKKAKDFVLDETAHEARRKSLIEDAALAIRRFSIRDDALLDIRKIVVPEEVPQETNQ